LTSDYQNPTSLAVARLAAIVESSDDAIISKDLESRILTWNGGAERIYGYSAAEAIGQSMEIVTPVGREAEETDIVRRIRAGIRVEHFETKRRRKDGKLIDVSLTISPVRDSSGVVIGASHIARDITERKQFEEQLRQSQRLESLGIMAGGIAHDFNNYLTGILGNASLIAEALPASSSAQQLVHDLIAAGQRLSDLTRQLLAYSGKAVFSLHSFSLPILIQEIGALIHSSLPRLVELRMEFPADLPDIYGDASQIQQIVMNLIINGAEAIGERPGTVLVTAHRQSVDEHYISTVLAPNEMDPGEYVCLEVHDTGKGMDQATRSKIFDPFFTTKDKGRGLGLAAVIGIIRGHRGAIKVYSELGQGTVFKVFLPIAREKARPVVPPPVSDLRGHETILFVDDEEIVRKVARSALEHYGYRVITADDGRQGVETYREKQAETDLIILDLVMPRMGGEQAFDELRRINRDVPIVIASGYSDTEALARFRNHKVAGFLRKPFTAKRAAEVVSAALRQSGT
jgi:PAS domain S-box-containing protein